MRRIFFSFLLIHPLVLISQVEPRVGIEVLAKKNNQKVQLRWAPTTPYIWQLGNKAGYRVGRFSLSQSGNLLDTIPVLLSLPVIKPLTASQMEALGEQNDNMAALFELIYGEYPEMNPENPHSVFSANEDLENKFGASLFLCDLNTAVARAAGLYFEDSSYIEGGRYIYRITLTGDHPDIEPGVVVVDTSLPDPILSSPNLSVEFRDRTALLSWSSTLHRGEYSAFYIERSEDSIHFSKRSDLPYVHMTGTEDPGTSYYMDSLDFNNKPYWFRIRGISPFGDIGPPSNIVHGKGKDNLSGMLIIREGEVHENNIVRLSWEFPSEAEQLIKAFRVLRSARAEGPFEVISATEISPMQRSYDDVTPSYNTYYILQAVDHDDTERARSFPYLIKVEDNEPPHPPSGLYGTIDSAGIVRLQWSPSSAQDLQGYRVFRSNSPTGEPIEVTRALLSSPNFTDTIAMHTLDKVVYYCVVATDIRFNTSAYSEVVAVRRPDLIPPVPSVFRAVEAGRDSVTLRWTNSPSRDAAGLELVRSSSDGIAITLAHWPPPFPEMYRDLPPCGITHRYQLVVADSAGNTSQALSGEVVIDSPVSGAVSRLRGIADRTAQLIRLTWDNPAAATRIFVYRQKNDGPLVLYRTLEGNVNSFSDEGIAINNTYAYRIQVMMEGGKRTRLSDVVRVGF